MAVALTTSAYTAPAKELKSDFGMSQEVFELGLSLFVLGFAVGPIFWGPLSELYGRQIVFVGTVSRNALFLLALPYYPPNTLDAVRRPDRFQRRMCCSFESRRPAHYEVPGWSVWIVALDQRRWCRSRYLAGPSTRARPCCLLISATVWTGRQSHSRRLPWRKMWMALGARLSVIYSQPFIRVFLVNRAFHCDTCRDHVHPRRCDRTGNLWTTASQTASASTLRIDRSYIRVQVNEGRAKHHIDWEAQDCFEQALAYAISRTNRPDLDNLPCASLRNGEYHSHPFSMRG